MGQLSCFYISRYFYVYLEKEQNPGNHFVYFIAVITVDSISLTAMESCFIDELSFARELHVNNYPMSALPHGPFSVLWVL